MQYESKASCLLQVGLRPEDINRTIAGVQTVGTALCVAVRLLGRFVQYFTAQKSQIPILKPSYMQVAKEGALIIDHKYDADGFGALHDRIETMSAGKTITAAVVGAAVQQGLFSLDVPLIEYGVSDALANWNQTGVDFFPNLTARHLLTQTSGKGQLPPGSALTYDSDTCVRSILSFDKSIVLHHPSTSVSQPTVLHKPVPRSHFVVSFQ